MNILTTVLNYFNLNKRAGAGQVSAPLLPPPLESSIPLPFTAPSPTTEPPIALWKQCVFYLGLMIGILLSSAVMQFQSGKATTMNITPTTLVISCVVAFVLMPYVYEKALRPEALFIVQLGLFIQSGVFWSVIFTSIGKAL
jgi:hypothetical protein